MEKDIKGEQAKVLRRANNISLFKAKKIFSYKYCMFLCEDIFYL